MAKLTRYRKVNGIPGLPDTTNISDPQLRLFLDRIKQRLINSVSSESEIDQKKLVQQITNNVMQVIPSSGQSSPSVNDGGKNLQRISISPTSLTINKYYNSSSQLTVNYSPSDILSNQKGVTWSSSDTSIATVDSSGTVTAKSTGSCTITAVSLYDDKIYDSVKTNVINKAESNLKSIDITPNPIVIEMVKNKIAFPKIVYTPEVIPSNQKGVTWSSSDTSIATVNSSGTVTAKSTGECTITAVSDYNSSISASAKVQIDIIPLQKINVLPATVEINMKESETASLSVSYTPSYIDGSQKGVTWSSSDTSIATVNSSGTVTAKSTGECTITAVSDYDQSISDSSTITVGNYIDIEAEYQWYDFTHDRYVYTEEYGGNTGEYVWKNSRARIEIEDGQTEAEAKNNTAITTIKKFERRDCIVISVSAYRYWRMPEEDIVLGYSDISVSPCFIYGKYNKNMDNAVFWSTRTAGDANVAGSWYDKAKYPRATATEEEKAYYSTENSTVGNNPNSTSLVVMSVAHGGDLSQFVIGGTEALPLTLASWKELENGEIVEKLEYSDDSWQMGGYGYLVKTGKKTTIYDPNMDGVPGYNGDTFYELETYDGRYTLWCGPWVSGGGMQACVRSKPIYIQNEHGVWEISPSPNFTNSSGNRITHTWVKGITMASENGPFEFNGKLYAIRIDPFDTGLVFDPYKYYAWQVAPQYSEEPITVYTNRDIEDLSYGDDCYLHDDQTGEFTPDSTVRKIDKNRLYSFTGKNGNVYYSVETA